MNHPENDFGGGHHLSWCAVRTVSFRLLREGGEAALQGPTRKIKPFSAAANDVRHETSNEAYEPPRRTRAIVVLKCIVKTVKFNLSLPSMLSR